MTRDQRRFWRYVRVLAVPLVVWGLIVALLSYTVRSRLQGNEEYDRAALREWVEESRVFRETLPEMVRQYLAAADPAAGRQDLLGVRAQEIWVQMDALGTPTKMYPSQLPLFPQVFRLELRFPESPDLKPIVWESGVPRSHETGQARQIEFSILGRKDRRAALHMEYQLHAYDKRQRDEAVANLRLRWMAALAAAATGFAFLWILFVQKQERERELQRTTAQQQLDHAERAALEHELRRQEAERRHEETARQLLEQQLATQAAESRALEMKSQLYASIGIMAGSYAHNIKNLLVRPNDLLRRCLEADGLPPPQGQMLQEVRSTLGTVTERLQQILQTVRRDPNRSVLTRLDLNAIVEDTRHTWEDLAREKWKLTLTAEPASGPIWIEGDASHLQQAVENLLFNARDATFEMRNTLREQARRGDGNVRQALIDAAAWKGSVVLRTRRDGDQAVLEVQDNGIGMTEEVRARCTETHFSTKRDNALYEGNNTGMGLGLSFVAVVLDNHEASLTIDTEPQRGALFRIRFPLAPEA